MAFSVASQHIGRFLAALAFLASTAQGGEITVFAAASLKEAMDDVASSFEESSQHTVILAYAGSSTLARQIEFGAPADVFVSASADWMNYLTDRGYVQTSTRMDLLGNRLVLIASRGQAQTTEVSPQTDLAGLLQNGRLAMALTDAVPAGIYGKSALQNLDLWESVRAAVAETDNVRAALALVAMGAAPLGIVYQTDALAEPRVAQIGVFPKSSHAEIVYPAAAIVSTKGQGPIRAFLDYLRGETAQLIFESYGFVFKAE